MTKRQRFSAGVKPLVEDFNAIGEHVESALAEALEPFGLTDGKLFYEIDQPIAVSTGVTTFDLLTPPQYIHIGGHTLRSTSYVEGFDHLGADMWIRVFFVARRTSISATRNFLSPDPGSGAPILQDLTTTIQDLPYLDVVYLYTTSLVSDPGEPILGPSDIDFIELATVQVSGGTVTITPELSPLYQLPASVSVSATPHAADHLSGGTDPIQLAQIVAIPEGSTEGLMPVGALAAAMEAITSLSPFLDSEFVKVSTSAPSTVGVSGLDRRSTQVGLRLHPSLEAVEVNSEIALSATLRPKNAINGLSDNVARADHSHSVIETGYIYDQVQLVVSTSNLGTLNTVQLPTLLNQARGRIITANAFWRPAALAPGFTENKVEASWTTLQSGTYGVLVHVAGPETVVVEIGSAGPVLLSSGAVTMVQGWTSPTYSGGLNPTDGTVIVEVVSMRAGAF